MINYFIDGPCGDCPKVCDSRFQGYEEDCVHWLAWESVLATIKEEAA